MNVLDDLEDLCIAIKVKKNIIFAYPFDYDIASHGGKVVNRKGKTVHSIQLVEKNGEKFITGVFAGTRYKWDIGGRFRSPYVDDYMDLYIPERYWDSDWKEKMKMTNAEWQARFGREHKVKPEYPIIENYVEPAHNEAWDDDITELNQ